MQHFMRQMACAELELRQAILIGFASRLARRMPTHNGYKTLGERSVLAQLHPVTASIAPDEDGLLPEWVVYHELIATSKNLLRKACSVSAFHDSSHPFGLVFKA